MKPLIVHALESLLLTTCMWKTHVPRRLVIEDPPPSFSHATRFSSPGSAGRHAADSQELWIKSLLLFEDSAEACQWEMSLQLHCVWEVYFV